MQNKIVVHFGAGNAGRGLMGFIYNENLMDIYFVDSNKDLVTKINKEKQYTIHELDTNQEHIIKNVKALHIVDDKQKIIEIISQAFIVSTTIGITNLNKIVSILNASLPLNPSVNVIACENGYRASTKLKSLLNEDTVKSNASFIDCSIDRIVPNQSRTSLNVDVESYHEWVLDETQSHHGLLLKYATMSKSLEKYIERKLFMLNTVHSAIAYLGYYYGYEYIHQSIEDPKIKAKINNFYFEIINTLLAESYFSSNELNQYQDKSIQRFSNIHIIDAVTRVARDPIRKLSKNDRYQLLLDKMYDYNVKHNTFLEIIPYVFKYDYLDDKQAQAIIHDMHNIKCEKCILKYLKLSKNDVSEVMLKYNLLKKCL